MFCIPCSQRKPPTHVECMAGCRTLQGPYTDMWRGREGRRKEREGPVVVRKGALSVTNGACAVGLREDLCRGLALHVHIPANQTGVTVKWCPEDPAASPAISSHMTDPKAAKHNCSGLCQGLWMPSAEREDLCQLGTFRPCGCCWRGVVAIMCWEEWNQKLS